MANFSQGGFGGLARGLEAGLGVAKQFRDSDLAERRFQSNKDLQNRKFQLDKARGGRAQQELNSKIGNKLLDTLTQQVESVVGAEGVDPQARLKTLEGMKKIFGEVYQPSLAANGINVDLGGLIDAAASRVAKASDAATIARNTAAAQTQPKVLRGNAATARSKLGPQEVGAPSLDDPTQVQKAFINPVTGKAEPISGTKKSRITVQAPNLAGAGLTAPQVGKEIIAAGKLAQDFQGFRESSDNLLKTISEGGDQAISAAGTVASGIESGVAAARGFFQLLGDEPPPNVMVDAKGKKTPVKTATDGALARLEKAGIKNAVFKSEVIGLALAGATLAGQTGQGLSNKDFDRFIEQVAGAGGAKKRATVVENFSKNLEKKMRTKYRVRARVLKTRGIDLPPVSSVFDPLDQPGKTTQPPVTPGGFTEGQTATGANGERIVFRNGQWAPLQ